MIKKTRISPGVPTKSASKYGWLRRIFYLLAVILFSLPFLLTAFIFYIGTESGLKHVTNQLNRFAKGAIHIDGVQGRLWHEVAINGIRIETSELKIIIDSLQLRWQASRLWSGELLVNQLAIGATRIDHKPTILKPAIATKAPSSLTLPLHINMPDITLARLAIGSHQAILSDVALTLKSDGLQHELLIKRMATSIGKLQGQATLSGMAPFAAQGHIDLLGTLGEKPLHATLKANGSLRQLYAVGGVESPIFNADLDVLLDIFAPYKYDLVRNGQVEINDFDPSLFYSKAPKAQIFLKADIRPVGVNHAKGQVYIENKKPNAVDLRGIPLTALDMDWQVSSDQLQIDAINMYLSKKGKVRGKGILYPATFILDLTAQGVDLQALLSKQARSAVEGTLKLEGAYNAPNLSAKLQDPTHQLSLLITTAWRTSSQEHTLLIEQLSLTQQQGKLQATGELGLVGKRPFKLAAKMEAFDPAQLGQYPSGHVNATVKAEGLLPPQLQAKLSYSFQPSYFNGVPLSGKGEMIWRDNQFEHANANLRLGDNYLAINGRYGDKKGHVAVQLDFANLAQVGRGFAGTLRGQANIHGHQQDIAIQTQLQAADLKLPGEVAIRTLSLEGNIEPNLQRPFLLSLKGEAIEVSKLNLVSINAHLSGTRNHHTIHLESRGGWDEQPIFMNARLTGSLPTLTTWQGNIPALKMGFAAGTVALQSTASLSMSPENIQLERAVLASTHSHVDIQKFALGKNRIHTQGQLTRLDIADVLAWMPNEAAQSNLVLNGSWQLIADETINGKIELKRQQGDVIWNATTPGAKPAALNVSDLNIHAIVQNGQANIDANLRSQSGTLKATAVTVLSQQEGKWGIYNTSPLTLRVSGNIPNLEAISAFINPTLKLGGQLNMDVTRTGTLGRATLSGVVQGRALVIQDTALGVNLTEGIVNARLTPDIFVLEKCTFKGGSGVLQAQGDIGLDNRNASIAIQANRLTALSRPDMLVILSGQSNMFMKNGELTIEGQAHIDEAKIHLANGDAPRLSDDVVIIGRTEPQQVKPENFTLAALQLEVDLGKKTTFSGKGVAALLGGKLHLAAHAKQPIYATGVIRIDEGSYRAYSQNLTINRGFISFQGPLDNPGLDIVAVRKGPAVEAGVKVSGTAIRPHVTLISEPNVPDNEKISWMMFGKGTDTLSPQDSASVLAAASSLWLTGDGPSLQQRIADTVGLDEVGITSGTTASTAATTYLTLSKRLAENVYLSYEQGLGEVDSALKLQYIFSRHWQAVARAGTKETTFDIFYTISFD
jgi:translocation and assembly module TamB